MGSGNEIEQRAKNGVFGVLTVPFIALYFFAPELHRNACYAGYTSEEFENAGFVTGLTVDISGNDALHTKKDNSYVTKQVCH